MFDTVELTDFDLENLSKAEEGQRLDFKSSKIKPAKLSETVSALANTDGGEIFVGIEDDGEWVGYENPEAANDITAMIYDVFPVQDYIEAFFLKHKEKTGIVLKLEISRTPDVKYATTSRAFKRFGAQNRKLSTDASVRQLEYTKGVNSYEDQALNESLVDVENSKEIIEFSLNIVPHPEPEQWLKKQKLVVGDKATVAACMLFSDEPQILLPKASIKLYRYRTAEKEGSRDTLVFDPITIEGSIVQIIKQAVRLTKEKVQDIPKIGESGLESIIYPEEAIHEVVTNAILHRDYSAHDDVHIRIFDNRIEVFSPGKMPGFVTPKNILKERFARNPKMVRLANKFPDAPNKDVGEGLNTAFEKMRELKLRDPVIEETDAGVTVVLYHELLASPEKLIEDYLKVNAEVNNSVAREICREGSENKMKRVFERMMAADIIERIPEKRGRATAYRLKA